MGIHVPVCSIMVVICSAVKISGLVGSAAVIICSAVGIWSHLLCCGGCLFCRGNLWSHLLCHIGRWFCPGLLFCWLHPCLFLFHSWVWPSILPPVPPPLHHCFLGWWGVVVGLCNDGRMECSGCPTDGTPFYVIVIVSQTSF